MRALITGGCGFLGTNMAETLLARGDQVRILDNLSRRGTERNREFLESRHGTERLEIRVDDIRDAEAVTEATRDCDVVMHLAAQVAVTTSVAEPREDFEINALGTLNVLEAARRQEAMPPVLYSSTNKVYGGMEDVAVAEGQTRYGYVDLTEGVSESHPLDFHSPYGCSKGAADQYIRDYARIYGLPTVVFRTSCLYGPHQFGNEDQGWVAHFVISAAQGEPLNIYGDGKQVRDVLYVDDAIGAYLVALEQIERAAGQVFNLGGGPHNSVSLLEFLDRLEAVLGSAIPREFADWRPGDQRIYVSDIRRLEEFLGWAPSVGVTDGVRKLLDWVTSSGYFPVAPATRS
jgi:CDP-paratose 2-epimerase